MKTTMYLTAVLAIAIQAMVNGQTQNNPSTPAKTLLLPTVKHQPVFAAKNKALPLEKQAGVQTIEMFANRIDEINKQISALEELKSQVNEEINDLFVQNVSNSTPDALDLRIVSREELITTFQKQADMLHQQSASKKKEALLQKGLQKKETLQSASQLEAQALAYQAEASVLSGKISKEKFEENNDHISMLLQEYYGSRSKLAMIGDLVFDANRSMRMAAEMREEANTYPNPAAKLGALQNAEEKEFVALSKQNEVLGMFGNTICAK